jgi:hypothetical protein
VCTLNFFDCILICYSVRCLVWHVFGSRIDVNLYVCSPRSWVQAECVIRTFHVNRDKAFVFASVETFVPVRQPIDGLGYRLQTVGGFALPRSGLVAVGWVGGWKGVAKLALPQGPETFAPPLERTAI